MNARTLKTVLVCALAAALAAGAGCTGGGAGAQTSAPAGAGAPTAAVYPLTITDDASRTVTIEKQPERIVSLAPANTEIVFALGLGDKLFGVTTFDDYPPAAKQLPKVGDFANPNLEAVAGARPDVVLVTGGVQADVIGKLEALGAKVLVIDPQTIDGVLASILKVGTALGAKDAADAQVAKMSGDLAAIKAKVAADKPRSAFIEVGWKPLFTAGTGTLLDDMLRAAGGTNVVKQSGYVGYSTEQLVADQPYAYLGTASSIQPVDGLPDRPGYDALTAIEQGRMYSLDDNLVSRPGPRIVDGVRQIAEALHPEAFGK